LVIKVILPWMSLHHWTCFLNMQQFMSVLAVFRNSGEINNGNLSDKEDKVQNSQQIWDLTHSINLFWPLGSRRAKKANLEGAGS